MPNEIEHKYPIFVRGK
jgi:hypothetical protein